MHFDVVTLFPEMFDALTGSGITHRARTNGLYELVLWNPRDFAANAYRSVDDRPYGGGPGMGMIAEPLERSIAAAVQRQQASGGKKAGHLHLTPEGRPLDHALVTETVQNDGLVMLPERY